VAGGIPRTALESCTIACVNDCVAMGGTEEDCRPGCDAVCPFDAPIASQTGYVIDGGSFSSQAWSVPNDLGCPDLSYRPTAVSQIDERRADGTLPICGDEDTITLPSQSREGGFAIVDSDPAFDIEPAVAATSVGHGIDQCQRAPNVMGEVADVNYMDPPMPECCPPALDQFCGLPLCEARDAGDGAVAPDPAFGFTGEYPYPEAVVEGLGGSRQTREIRVLGEDYEIVNGQVRPLCTPFLMPVACCQAAAMRASGS
jgi:hypothetical protein